MVGRDPSPVPAPAFGGFRTGYGCFGTRQIALPTEVRADEISAAFHNGVLAVTVPRAQKAQPKRIPVTSTAPAPATVVDAEASRTSG